MRKILVAFDASENARRALQFAIQLARKNGETALVIVHAHAPPDLYGEVAVYVTREKMQALQERHSADILEPAAALARSEGVPFTTEILSGDIPLEIVRRAEELGCEQIVIGTRGMGLIGSLVLGSVATKLVHLSKVPVTLVK